MNLMQPLTQASVTEKRYTLVVYTEISELKFFKSEHHALPRLCIFYIKNASKDEIYIRKLLYCFVTSKHLDFFLKKSKVQSLTVA